MSFLGYIDNLKKMDFIVFGAWANTGQGFGHLRIELTMLRSIKSLGGLTRGRGMNEAVRNLWIGTLHSCSEVGKAMRNVTVTKKQTSEQHVELGTSRCNRDLM